MELTRRRRHPPIVGLLALLMTAGPALERSDAQTNRRDWNSDQPADPVTLGQLSAALDETRSELRRLIGGTDLIDGLYFGWLERPYTRADIACSVKTFTVLEFEERLRRLGTGALSDAQVRDMLHGLAGLAARTALAPRRRDFYPHRIHVDLDALLNDGAPALAGLRLFGFVDRATATRFAPQGGDFDLLACMGFRVVAGPSPPMNRSGGLEPYLGGLARTLGIERVHLDPKTGAAWGAVVRSGTLGDFIDRALPTGGQDESSYLPAIQDRVLGESWAESLARRALYRGCTAKPGAVVTGWRPPRLQVGHDDSAQISLAMWVHALWGQRLALMEGWRDRRDGSASPYPSLFSDPTLLATVASTALDLLYVRQALAAFEQPGRVVVLVTHSAVDARDANRWAQPYADLFDALLGRQVFFDVVPAWRWADLLDRPFGPPLIGPPVDDLDAEFRSSVSELSGRGVYYLTGSGWPADRAVLDKALRAAASNSDWLAPAVRVTGSNLLVLCGRDGSVALANTGPDVETAWITTSNGLPTRALNDLVSQHRFDRPDQGVICQGWQIRVLRPSGR